jgi:hypothetical protein
VGRLLSSRVSRGWWIFEGPTYPDVFIETPGALIVVEGKRTEAGPTTCTTWMKNRHQIWRHMDAAWEVRGDRAVYGLFIVQGEAGTDVAPLHWQLAAATTLGTAAIEGSFPHRSADERLAIARGFLGVTTWRGVCERFGIDHEALPDTVLGIKG